MKDGERLVLVERFEELATGMRAARTCPVCRAKVPGLIGSPRPWPGTSWEVVSCDTGVLYSPRAQFTFTVRCCTDFPVITEGTVAAHRVYRYAEDLGIADQLAAESNPYTSRSVLGTNGTDEVRVVAKDRR